MSRPGCGASSRRGRRPARAGLVGLAVLLVLLGIASSCSGDGDDDGPAASTTTAPRPPESGLTDGDRVTTTVASTGPGEAVPDDLGDDPVLDGLWQDCDAGSGEACDELFRQAPVGSAYEEFGYTCGGRPEVVVCTDLDEETA